MSLTRGAGLLWTGAMLLAWALGTTPAVAEEGVVAVPAQAREDGWLVTPVSGTQTDYRLQDDVTKELFKLAAMPECHDASVRMEVLKPSDDGTTPWIERWFVDMCGMEKRYRVLFTPDLDVDGGTIFAIEHE